MTYNRWPKGSQWRKWDLHVHTPASFHWKGGALLHNMNAQEKDAAFSRLLETIQRSDVAVFCFMDYWTFDGYVKFRSYLRDNDLACTKTIFPGMELRVEAPVDYRLNIHVILSDQLSDQQLNDFKSCLRIRGTQRPISDEAIIEFARGLDASKSKVHGFNLPANLDHNELLQLGSMTIEVTKDSLEHAIRAVPSATAYVVLPYDTSDGFEKLDWKTQPHADNYFMQSADAFESRRADVADLFLGVETDKNRDFIQNFQKTLGHRQKPVICGSDAHRFSDYGNFPSDRITWIKADPTFQGFRQILFEPRERVSVQYLPPEDQVPYLVIDKVRFKDGTGTKLFSPEWIELNENLNTVIGGKSSGKSLLLYHIVKTVSPELLDRRCQEISIPTYRFGDTPNLDFEVCWKDGHTDILSEGGGFRSRKIEYIPQMYVNALAEKDGRSSLYELIESILDQNDQYKEFIELVREDILQLESSVEHDVTSLLKLREDLRLRNAEKKAIGDSTAVQNEIERLTRQITVLREESGFNEQEKRRYETLQQQEHIQLARQRRYDALHGSIMGLTTSVAQSRNQAIKSLADTNAGSGLDRFGKRIVAGLSNHAMDALSESYDSIDRSQRSLAELARIKAQRCGENASRIKGEMKPYLEKVRDQQLLAQLSEKLKREQDRLNSLEAKSADIRSIIDEGRKARENLIRNYTQLFEDYRQIVSKLKLDEYSRIDDEIVLDASLEFDVERFWDSFCDLFDRRSNFSSVFGPCFDQNNNFCFDETAHVERVVSIFEVLSRDTTMRFKGRSTANEAIGQLFTNYFVIRYNLRYKGDDILEMSPGKRGLVLLQLILHISNATHPILIDQPEDNLDNRTISNELKQFIKSKKLARQIIMVTHDANLVVLTDAENIIVSNQAGQQVAHENAEFRFEYVTGALEHSKQHSGRSEAGILQSRGVREHVCDILEGGEEAFRKREQKYGFAHHGQPVSASR